VTRIRHLELQDRVGTLEEDAIQAAQQTVEQTVSTAAAAAAAPVSVSAISLKETVRHGGQAHASAKSEQTLSQKLSRVHLLLVMAAHPYARPSITQLLQSEVLVDELAKWAKRQEEIEQRTKNR